MRHSASMSQIIIYIKKGLRPRLWNMPEQSILFKKKLFQIKII